MRDVMLLSLIPGAAILACMLGHYGLPRAPENVPTKPTRLLSVGADGNGPFEAELLGVRIYSWHGVLWQRADNGQFVDTAGVFLGPIDAARYRLAVEAKAAR